MKTIYATTALTFAFANAAFAGEFGCPCCESCGGACVLKVEQVDEEETCYDVECKEVCIPAVRFPWDACRTPRCGRVRLVAKLKEEKRDAKSCKYEWVVTCTRCGRAASPSQDDSKSSSKTKPADGAPPVPPPMPPANASTNAARNRDMRYRPAAKPQAVGFANYIGRSSTR